jgi:hypothetical protein
MNWKINSIADIPQETPCIDNGAHGTEKLNTQTSKDFA